MCETGVYTAIAFAASPPSTQLLALCCSLAQCQLQAPDAHGLASLCARVKDRQRDPCALKIMLR